jgi:hypothetical protein
LLLTGFLFSCSSTGARSPLGMCVCAFVHQRERQWDEEQEREKKEEVTDLRRHGYLSPHPARHEYLSRHSARPPPPLPLRSKGNQIPGPASIRGDGAKIQCLQDEQEGGGGVGGTGADEGKGVTLVGLGEARGTGVVRGTGAGKGKVNKCSNVLPLGSRHGKCTDF